MAANLDLEPRTCTLFTDLLYKPYSVVTQMLLGNLRAIKKKIAGVLNDML